ncbi:uncharacterized protein TNCV_1478751 [Trichonephila clavipes]|nr:uncharacterized protein TNCV_1478751 [Trichonephila clavipes]
MDLISSRYRKPKGRTTKRRKMLAENSKKRWQKSSETVDEKNSNSMVLQRDTLYEPSTSSQLEASYISTHKAVFSELLQKVPCKYCTNPCYKTTPFYGVFYKDGTFMRIMS